MKFTLGFITGLAAAWAALAIWQRVPPLEEIDEPNPPRWSIPVFPEEQRYDIFPDGRVPR